MDLVVAGGGGTQDSPVVRAHSSAQLFPEVLWPHVEPGIWSHSCGRLSPTPSHYWWLTPWVTDFGTLGIKLQGKEVALDP